MSSSSTTCERWLSGAGVACVLALGAAGCGLQPGDYIVYRVSVGAESRSAGCYYPTFAPPIDVVEDSTSYLDSQTFVLYLGAPDQPHLDNGGVSFAGVVTDEGYTFRATQVDVTYLGVANDVKETETQELRIDVVQDGRTISGTTTNTVIPRCEFVTPAPALDLCPDPPRQVCERSARFFGVELSDVELDYAVP